MANDRDSKRLLADLEQLQNQLVQPTPTSTHTMNSSVEIPVLEELFIEQPPSTVQSLDTQSTDTHSSNPHSPEAPALASQLKPSQVNPKSTPPNQAEHLALLQQEALIDGLIDDMLPLIKSRLRDRIRQILEEE